MLPSTPSRPQLFVTTHWSVIAAAQDSGSPDARAALEQLCRAYWFPLYAYVRRFGRNPHDAQDLTQSFFLRLLEKDYLQAADPNKGRFRTFLLVALKRFMANEWDKAQALKRGGGVELVSLDYVAAENRYEAEALTTQPPEREYEHRWAITLLEQALAELRREYEDLGKLSEYGSLKECLTADRGSIPYPAIATALHMSEGAARTAVHRLRRRFREVFRAAVAATVTAPDDVEDELRHVVRALSWD